MRRSTDLAKIVCFLALGASVTSCYHKPPPPPARDYGHAYDPERTKRGILEIPAGWVRDPTRSAASGDGRDEWWVPPARPSTGSVHDGKVVTIIDAIIDRETDLFHSGASWVWTDPDGRPQTLREGLSVTYHYDEERAGGSDPWDFMYARLYDPVRHQVPRNEANRILRQWGFDPLPEPPSRAPASAPATAAR